MTMAGAAAFSAISTLVVVAILVGWALRAERRAKLQTAWPTVPGLVSRSEVVIGKTNRAKVVYNYSFNGRDYVGKVIQSNTVSFSGGKSPEVLCNRFPVGSRPTVFVDSLNPKRAVLIPGGDRNFLYFVLALAAFFLLTGGFTVAMMFVNPSH